MKPKLFDIHSHLNFPQFDGDREEVIKRMLGRGIWTICIGTDKKSSEECVALAEKYEGIYAAAGIHPTDTAGNSVSDIRELAKHPRVVAIGECGLDFYRRENNELGIRQKELFIEQIELSLELGKPLMIHCRDAHKEILEIISTYKLHDSSLAGNIHFFSGTWEEAKKYFELDFTISFAGPITFSNQYDEIIKNVPVNMIMVETDAPFACPLMPEHSDGRRAAPSPYRGKRSEPAYVEEVAKKIAEIRGISYEEAAEKTTQNALKFFKIEV